MSQSNTPLVSQPFKTDMISEESKETFRPLPKNYEAEQALLGALLHNNASFEKVAEFLLPEHFADPMHARIFEAIGLLISQGHVADPITLKDYFTNNDALEDVGGWRYLVNLAASVVSILNTHEYGRIIYDLYLRRKLIALGEDIVNEAHTPVPDLTAHDQMEKVEQQLFDLATTGHFDRGFYSFSEALTAALENAEVAFKNDSHVVGVTSGLTDIDKWLGGLHPSDLLILAGRPSMGKTALATNIAYNAALAHLKEKQGANVAFFSLEMSAEQLATRILSQETGVGSDRIRRGEISNDDFIKFTEVGRTLAQLPLYIDDTPALSLTGLRTRARRLMRQKNIGLIIIDYLQLLHVAGKGKVDGRVQEISEISRGLKALAKELNVPVLALSQLSRAVEQRDDKRPQLADLRESGSIEQDADVVLFIFREEYYEARKKPPEDTDKHVQWLQRMNQIYNKAEIIVAKHRHGPVGTVNLFFDSQFTKFGNLAQNALSHKN